MPAHAFRFTHIGPIRGKGRPRWDGRHGRMHTDTATQRYERTLAEEAKATFRGPLLTGALALRIEVYLPVPASFYRRKREAALAGILRPTGRPDVDNIGKIVGDALNAVVWRDDSQIAELFVARWYVDADQPRAEIAVWQLP